MRFLKNYLVFFCITAVFLFFRIFFSDPWNTAVSTNDTGSYVSTAESDIFSPEFYGGARSITLPLLMKVFAPPGGYDVSQRSEPSIGIFPGLKALPGFAEVAFSQSLLSVFSWWLLALVFYNKIHDPWLRFISSAAILLSASLPAITSWDHVMMAESLTYSLFALVLAFGVLVLNEDLFNESKVLQKKGWLSAGFLISMFLWVNARDTNVYFLLVCIFSLTLGLFIPWIIRKFKSIPWPGIMLLMGMIGIYGLQQVSVRVSTRTLNPIINNLVANVFPYWTRVEFMHDKWGMPDSEDIISITGSANYSGIQNNPEFMTWVREKGMPAYLDFMINTPLWTTQKLIDSFEITFGYYKQPYFDPYYIPMPINAKPLTRMITWSSSNLVLITFLLIVSAFIAAIRRKISTDWPIIGILICLWLGAGVMYSASYLGETWGSATRHVQSSILIYRLILLAFIPLFFDRDVPDTKIQVNENLPG